MKSSSWATPSPGCTTPPKVLRVGRKPKELASAAPVASSLPCVAPLHQAGLLRLSRAPVTSPMQGDGLAGAAGLDPATLSFEG